MSTPNAPKKVTVHTIASMTQKHLPPPGSESRGEARPEQRKIAMVTAYDATFARLFDEAGCDMLLVGDSLGMVVKGEASTLSVTVDEIVYHLRAVARGTRRAQIVGDMPFMSYQSSVDEGLRNAGRLVKEGGAEAVKLEGGAEHATLVRRLVSAGIPVMGHIGLMPQSVHAMGGYRVQGRGAEARRRLLDDARALDEAGCYAIVLEGIPRDLGREITASVRAATIGIGAGPECDGQVLVSYDLLGMNDEFRPRFVKRYDHLAVRIRTAVEAYVHDVRAGQFPDEEHSFGEEATPRADAVPYGAPTPTGPAAGPPPAREDGDGGAEAEAIAAGCIPLPIRTPGKG
jgi:3-methyl-2-oxobutanoate hydroxymethyltransferase